MIQKLTKSNSMDPSQKHIRYEPCPERSTSRIKYWNSDLDHVLQVIRQGPILSEPFKFSSFLCDVWPPKLYKKMLKYYIPVGKSLNNFSYTLGNAPCYFKGHCGESISDEESCHKEFDLKNLFELRKIRERFENFELMMSTWTRVLNVLNSEEVADLLWQKLNVLEVRESRQLRLIHKLPTSYIDKIHSDSPHTIATIIFMFPNKLDEVFEYGTCFYSPKPDYMNSMLNPSNCSHKVRFFPNSAFMFRTVPGKIGGKYYFDPKRRAITFGRETRKLYRDKNISFPSWHATPSMQYNTKCEINWRRSLFLTFSCTGMCVKKWKGG